jgi:hypothetical protein
MSRTDGINMLDNNKLNPRKFLKSAGFLFDIRPSQRDARLAKLLSPQQREIFEDVTMAAAAGVDKSTDLYAIPQSLKQASVLFSHDAKRYLVSMNWVADLIAKQSPETIIDMGCVAGLLLNFIQQRFPNIRVNGIDLAENLIEIGRELTELNLIFDSYLTANPDDHYDLIVCEFGYDNSNIPPSTKPHTSANCGAVSYCPGCAEDKQSHFGEYMKSWRKWGGEKSNLALVGRMANYSDVRAMTLAAKGQGWHVSLGSSAILEIKEKGQEPEKFPAFYFATDATLAASEEEIANFYSTG